MPQAVSISGAGYRSAIGLSADANDFAGQVELLFDAKPWEEQPAASGTFTLRFKDAMPTRFIAADGWGTMDPGVPDQVGNLTVAWTAPAPVPVGTRAWVSWS